MATIGKKFIEPDKWESAWFSKLSPGQKLLYCYLWERADHSGVIEIVYPVWSAHIGQKIDESALNKLIEIVNHEKDRIIIYGNKVFLCEYIRFQQKPDQSEPLSGTHGFTKTIARLLKGHGLYEIIKEKDQILFSAFEEQNTNSSTSKASVRLHQDYGKGLSKSKSQIGSGSKSISGSPAPFKGEKKESLTKIAERCLSVWPQTSEDIFFTETIQVENKLRELTSKGMSTKEAENNLKSYLKGEKIRLYETGEEQDLIKIINNFSTD